MASSSGLVLVTATRHHDTLVSGLWNFFCANHAVDFEIRWDGRSIRAHQLILDIFLSPKKPTPDSASPKLPSGNGQRNTMDMMMEFLYNGTVNVPRDKLKNLLDVAKELDFTMLIEAVEVATVNDKAECLFGMDMCSSRPVVRSGVSGRQPSQISYKERASTTSTSVEEVLAAKSKVLPAGNQQTADEGNNSDDDNYAGVICQLSDMSDSLSETDQPTNLVRPSDDPTKSTPDQQPRPMAPLQLPALIGDSSRTDQQQQQHHGGESSYAAAPDFVVRRHQYPFPIVGPLYPHLNVFKAAAAAAGATATGMAGPEQYPTIPATTVKQARRPRGGKGPYMCDYCPKIFKRSQHRNEHLLTHTGEKPFKCHLCGKAYSQSGGLFVHMRTHSGIKPYKCQLCNKAFNQSGALSNHMLLHTGERPHQCSICSNTFQRRQHLNDHMLSHTAKKKFKCEECNAEFSHSQWTKFNLHKLEHSGKTPYVCDICGTTFAGRKNLASHKRNHRQAGLKLFQCHECGKEFRVRISLERHMRLHTGERPYKCDLCSKAFTSDRSLARHVRSGKHEKMEKGVQETVPSEGQGQRSDVEFCVI